MVDFNYAGPVAGNERDWPDLGKQTQRCEGGEGSSKVTFATVVLEKPWDSK